MIPAGVVSWQGALLGAGLICAAVSAGFAPCLRSPAGLPPPALREIVLTGRVVPDVDRSILSKRRGRVREVRVEAGQAVAAGDPLVGLFDLALSGARDELADEIAALSALPQGAGALAKDRSTSDEAEVRRAALRELEEAHKAARLDFERWKTLYGEGLVARVAFEEQRDAFDLATRRLEEARAVAGGENGDKHREPGATEAPGLARAQRLLRRMERLNETFEVRSPWHGIVREVHVAPGDSPHRGAPLVTVSRALPGRLQAAVPAGGSSIVQVASACGQPGPFGFSVAGGLLTLAVPPTRDGEIRASATCRIVVLQRGRLPSQGNGRPPDSA